MAECPIIASESAERPAVFGASRERARAVRFPVGKGGVGMPFRFRMQKVLDYRAQLEEEAKVRLADAERRLRESRERLEAVLGELARAEEKSRAGLLQSGERWLHGQYLRGLRSDAAQAELQCRMLEQLAEEARSLLAARAMERKLLEKLKERQKIQYLHAERLQEQHFNDEISTLRYKASAF